MSRWAVAATQPGAHDNPSTVANTKWALKALHLWMQGRKKNARSITSLPRSEVIMLLEQYVLEVSATSCTASASITGSNRACTGLTCSRLPKTYLPSKPAQPLILQRIHPSLALPTPSSELQVRKQCSNCAGHGGKLSGRVHGRPEPAALRIACKR